MTIFEIKLFSEETKRYQFLAAISAETAEQARNIFIERNKYKDRKGYRLFVKTPGCL